MVDGVSDGISSWDIYGQPVTLNIQGEEKYKTCPGGILSIAFLAVVLFYMGV